MALGAVVVFAVGLAAQKDQPAALAVGTGSAQQGPSPNSATSTTVNPFRSIVAQAKIPKVGIYDSPSGDQPARTLNSPQPSGAPLVFLVKQTQKDWLDV